MASDSLQSKEMPVVAHWGVDAVRESNDTLGSNVEDRLSCKADSSSLAEGQATHQEYATPDEKLVAEFQKRGFTPAEVLSKLKDLGQEKQEPARPLAWLAEHRRQLHEIANAAFAPRATLPEGDTRVNEADVPEGDTRVNEADVQQDPATPVKEHDAQSNAGSSLSEDDAPAAAAAPMNETADQAEIADSLHISNTGTHGVVADLPESQPRRVNSLQYAPDPVPVGLPEAPWRIDAETDIPVAQDWIPSFPSSPIATAPAWQCALMRRLTFEKGSVAEEVWKRWAKSAEDIVSQHVATCFSEIATQLSQVSKGAGDGDVHAMLALAGSDVADHEATMHQVEGLIRSESPHCAIALVSPENFRNLAHVMRNICQQLMTGSTRILPDSESRDACEAEADEGEWPEDCEPRDSRQAFRGGLVACMDWLTDRRSHGGGPVVLLVERTEAVPKDVLRDMLTSLGSALGDKNIPFFALFGLQHPPQDCFDLFEGKPLANVLLLGAVRLFDARTVSARILEGIVEDPMCLLALSPQILDWLRKDRFEYTRQSVAHIMKSLALLCAHFFTANPCAGLCAPIDASFMSGGRLEEEDLQKVFDLRLQRLPGVMEHLLPHWEAWDESVGDKGADILRADIAKAAAQAACWRQLVISSLGVWDALCRAMQPLARHEPRLRRLCRLLVELWPKESSTDAASLADAFMSEQDELGCLVLPCISGLKDPSILNYEQVLGLLDELVVASSNLDSKLKKEICDLKRVASSEKEVRSGMKNWLHRIRVTYWLPLQDSARIVFREMCWAQCHDDIALNVEMRLAGRKGFTVESPLRSLSIGSKAGNQAPDDFSVVYRLLECATSKSIEVADLWRNFAEFAAPSPSESALKLRFGRALLGLHVMGLFAPQSGGKADTGASFDHWRLRKKHFGRVWLKAKDAPETDPVASLCETRPESVADVQLAISNINSESQPKELPAWAQRWLPETLRSASMPPSLLKRQLPGKPTGFDPSAKRARGPERSKPRIFMS